MRLQTDIYEFEDFRLDLGEKTLYRGGTNVPITPKVFDLLELFIENPGHLVEKDELMRRIWPDRFVEESNITFNIKMLRKALGDNAHKPQFIETVQSRGYRFIADVRRTATNGREDAPIPRSNGFANTADGDGKIPIPASYRASRLVRSRPLMVTLMGTVIVGVLGLGYYFLTAKGPLAVNGKKSIAVLPLKPIDLANRDDVYELGIADSLIHKLNSMRGFVVRPLSATRSYVDISQDPIVAGQEQKVDYVLTSNYQLTGGKIRVTAQLWNVASGQSEETYKIDKDAADVLAMEDAIAGEMGMLLSGRFSATSSGPPAERGTANEAAYRLYLQGMYLLDKRNPSEARKAVDIFEQAVELDPNYARAWAGKARAHRIIAGLGRSVDTIEEYQRSMEAVNKALALDENLADAHGALCDNKMQYEYDLDGAERECRRAIELDPNSAMGHQNYARYLEARGRFDEAIADIKTAIDLEPTSINNQRVYGSTLYFARRYDEAAVQLKRVIAMDPSHANAYPWLWESLEMQGKYDEAFEWLMKFQTLRKAQPEDSQQLRSAYETSGWHGVLLEQVRQFEQGNYVYFHGAGFNAKVGNTDKALDYLERSYQRHELWMIDLLIDPSLDSLHGEPRFDELARRVRLK